MNIILTGLRGSGKTTIGLLLGKKLHRSFIDLDQTIEKEAKKSISQIVSDHGWTEFRKREKKITEKISKLDHHVIATGGGTIIDETNARVLKKNGRVIFLLCDLTVIKKRLKKTSNRPALTQNGNFLNELETVWEKRKTIYEQKADMILDVSNLNVKAAIKQITKYLTN